MSALDVRGVPPGERFPLIMGAYEALAEGDSLQLTVDHDPECMYYTLLGTRGPDAFTFAYGERGPVTWRVTVTKLRDAPQLAAPWS